MVEWKENQIYPWVNGIEFLSSLNSDVITKAADRKSMLGFFIFFGWCLTFGFLSLLTIGLLAILQTIEWLMATFFMSIDNGIQNSKDNSFKEFALCTIGIVLASPVILTYGLPRVIWDRFNKKKETPDPVMTFDEIVEVIGREERKRGDFKPQQNLKKHKLNTRTPRGIRISTDERHKPYTRRRATDGGTGYIPGHHHPKQIRRY